MLWDSRVSVYHSAITTFCAPSNPSGLGGMYREAIHSTLWWMEGNISDPQRDCIFVDKGGANTLGMQGLLVTCIHLFFKFSYAGVEYPCTLVHWYTLVGTDPDNPTGLWMVEPEYNNICGHSYQSMGAIHLDCVIRRTHLLPWFPLTTQIP